MPSYVTEDLTLSATGTHRCGNPRADERQHLPLPRPTPTSWAAIKQTAECRHDSIYLSTRRLGGASGRGCLQPRRENHCRRNQFARLDEIAGRNTFESDRYQPAAARTGSRRRPTGDCVSARWFATAILPRPARTAALRRAERALLAGASAQLRNRPRPAAICCSERAATILRITKPLQQAQPPAPACGARRLQPHSRYPGHQRPLHRDASVGYGGGYAGARRQGGRRSIARAKPR